MITVLSLEEAKKQASNFDLVISLLDPSMKSSFVPFHPNQHVWWFNDTIWDFAGQVKATPKDIEEIIKVFEPFADKEVLVHCLAGISRSPAVAIGLKIHNSQGISEAFESTFEDRRQMWPNDLILSIFDEVEKLDHDLIEYDIQWKLKNDTLIW